MKKQKKQMIIMLVILLVLVAAYFGVQAYNNYEANKEEESTDILLFDESSSDIIAISYTYDGETVNLAYGDDGWYCTDDEELSINQTRGNYMASAITPLYVTSAISQVSDMSQYGLEEDYITISFTTSTATYTIYVGDANDFTGLYYICEPNNTTVYTMSSTVVSAFNYSLEDITEVEEEEEEETDEDADEADDEDATVEEDAEAAEEVADEDAADAEEAVEEVSEEEVEEAADEDAEAEEAEEAEAEAEE